jgi:hypothetical protein
MTPSLITRDANLKNEEPKDRIQATRYPHNLSAQDLPNIVIRDDARAQLGDINAPVTVTEKLILVSDTCLSLIKLFSDLSVLQVNPKLSLKLLPTKTLFPPFMLYHHDRGNSHLRSVS